MIFEKWYAATARAQHCKKRHRNSSSSRSRSSSRSSNCITVNVSLFITVLMCVSSRTSFEFGNLKKEIESHALTKPRICTVCTMYMHRIQFYLIGSHKFVAQVNIKMNLECCFWILYCAQRMMRGRMSVCVCSAWRLAHKVGIQRWNVIFLLQTNRISSLYKEKHMLNICVER